MSVQWLSHIEAQVDALIRKHRRLTADYADLQQREQQWRAERMRLLEKNDAAQTRIDTLLERLKKLEADSQ